ncbi:MAG: protein translocase subunit SecD [Tepidisphaeraceae bacterium]
MQHNISSRLLTILAVLIASLWVLWPKPWKTLAPNLQQGLDMKGGVSLIYQIKVPPGEAVRPDLSSQVAQALKTRVDPNGVRNLIWRPQGADRLEIQLPAGEAKAEDRKIRDAYVAAESELKSINISPLTVLATLDIADEATRQRQIDSLAQGSTKRKQIIDDLIQARKTKAELDAKWKSLPEGAAAPAEELDRYNAADDALKTSNFGPKLEATNVDIVRLQQAINFKDANERTKRIQEIRDGDPTNAKRLALIDEYVTDYVEFDKVKDTVDSVASLKALLRGSGVLSFHVVAKASDPAVPPGTFQSYRARLAQEGPRYHAGDMFRWYKIAEEEQAEKHAMDPSVAKFNGEYYQLLWITPEKSMINREGTEKWALTSARAGQDPQGVQTLIFFNFDPVGAKLFSDLTGRHKPGTPGTSLNDGYQVAAVLDEKVISAPTIQAQIGASGTISGGGKTGFSPVEADYLQKTLSAGALPAQLESEPIVERVIGPQLGADNLRRGLLACAAGVIVVAVFLVGYYFVSGVVAMVAVIMNLLLILAGMSAFGATFTLPGVAGIILTIGMAVDANVLIFERLREEQQRGLGVRVALHNAYKRAMTAIVDSNITTGISAVVLYLIGTEEVKGFGLTLLLGIVSSMFTALYVTRTVFYIMTEKWGIESLSSLPLRFPKLDRALRPNIDWMKLAPAFLAFSILFIVGGMGLFGYYWHQNKMLDIEFAGGTAVTIDLKEPMRLEDVRKIVNAKAEADAASLPAPSVTSVGDTTSLGEGTYKSFEIVTPNATRQTVMSALSQAFAGKLNVAEPVRFDDDRLTAQQLIERGANAPGKTRVIAIETGDEPIAPNFRPEGIEEYQGGVAVVLENVHPTLDPKQVEERLAQQRLLSGGANSGRNISVQKLNDGVGLVVLSYDNALRDSNNVQAKLSPIWDSIVGGLTAPAEFARVSGIDKSVASEARSAAIGALVVSVLGIVIYIWVRFGDMKYGSATVIALVHDTLFALAAVGFAHVLAETFVGRALLIDAFRINLTLVSGILSILGFSMNDTVVVFDRIRELRGQRGHLDRQIINDAINQTLSRTILTGGTTIATIGFMYILGGEAIHGFTYALFVGFLAGTYSSIAVAAPLLLIGLKRENSRLAHSAHPTATVVSKS